MRALNVAIALIAAVSSLANLANAQDLSSLPTCVLGAAVANLSKTGCATTDYKCICASSSFISALQAAASTTCSPMDLANAEQFAATLCASVGITIGAVSGSSSSPSPTSTLTSSSSAAPSSSLRSPTTTPASSATAYASVSSVSASSSYAPASNATMSAPSSKFTGAAAASYSYSTFGGLVAFMVALLL